MKKAVQTGPEFVTEEMDNLNADAQRLIDSFKKLHTARGRAAGVRGF